jgi:lactase-phlorizin hydrolase
MLNWIRRTYNNPTVIVTEAGLSDYSGQLDDAMRVYYYKYYINNVLKAINDGCNVIGYTAWSLMGISSFLKKKLLRLITITIFTKFF